MSVAKDPMGNRRGNYAPQGRLGNKQLGVKNPFAVEKRYLAARAGVDARLGAETSRARTWHLAWAATFAALVGVTGAAIYLGAQPKLVPHIIERDSNTGQYRYIGQVGQAAQDIPEGDIGAQVRGYIHDVRSISSDRYVNRDNWRRAKGRSTEMQRRVLSTWGRELQPQTRARSGEVRRVEVQWAQPISKATWQVEWKEITRKGGSPPVEKFWRANVTLEQRKPRDARDMIKCPTGHYVSEVHWNEYTTATPRGDQGKG